MVFFVRILDKIVLIVFHPELNVQLYKVIKLSDYCSKCILLLVTLQRINAMLLYNLNKSKYLRQ